MPEFQKAFAPDWEHAQDGRISVALAERNPWRRLELLLSDVLIPPDRSSVVWRSWGHTNPVVGVALRRAEEAFEHALTTTLAQLTDDGDRRLLAKLTVAFALGLHRARPPCVLGSPWSGCAASCTSTASFRVGSSVRMTRSRLAWREDQSEDRPSGGATCVARLHRARHAAWDAGRPVLQETDGRSIGSDGLLAGGCGCCRDP
jgi:hypothetical protein